MPNSITIKPGDSIRWTNTDPDIAHTTTRFGSGGWDSGLLNPGDTYSVTFNTTGSFPYICQIHSGQTGTVKVEN